MNEFLRGRVYNNLLDYYEAVNPGVNPIPELPEVVMRIYCCEYEFKSKYFDSSEECFKFAIGYNDSRCYVVDYLGTVGDRDNVVKETFGKEDSRLVSYIDDRTYEVYNEERSLAKGICVWNKYYGDKSELNKAFSERGIELKSKKYSKV